MPIEHMQECEKCDRDKIDVRFLEQCVGCEARVCLNCQNRCQKCLTNFTCNNCNLGTEQHPRCKECGRK